MKKFDIEPGTHEVQILQATILEVDENREAIKCIGKSEDGKDCEVFVWLTHPSPQVMVHHRRNYDGLRAATGMDEIHDQNVYKLIGKWLRVEYIYQPNYDAVMNANILPSERSQSTKPSTPEPSKMTLGEKFDAVLELLNKIRELHPEIYSQISTPDNVSLPNPDREGTDAPELEAGYRESLTSDLETLTFDEWKKQNPTKCGTVWQ